MVSYARADVRRSRLINFEHFDVGGSQGGSYEPPPRPEKNVKMSFSAIMHVAVANKYPCIALKIGY